MAKKKVEKPNKRSNKLRRTILGTLSGVFMISAMIVAAIPVKDVEAVDDTGEFTEDDAITALLDLNGDATNGIPNYTGSNVFYQDDGRFGVARLTNTTPNQGVLVYYNLSSQGTGTLNIPTEIKACQYEFDPSYGNGENFLRPVYQNTTSGGSGGTINDGTEGYLYFAPDVEVSANSVPSDVDPSTTTLVPCYTGRKGENDKANQELWEGRTLYDKDGHVHTQLTVPVNYIGSTRYVLELENVGADGQPTGGKPAAGHYASGDEETGVFAGATNFSNLNIPDGILAIGDNAFKGCSMASVVIYNVKAIGHHAFDGCISLNRVSLTQLDSTSLSRIGNYAFANCSALSSIDIPDDVVTIGNGCFMNCVSMSAANLYGHDITDEEGELIPAWGNTRLTGMGNGAFYGCARLRYVYLPRNLSVEGAEKWFYGCSSMLQLSLPEVASGTFKANNVTGCSGLTIVTVPNNNMQFDCEHALETYCPGEAGCTFSVANLGSELPIGDSSLGDRFIIKCKRNSEAYRYACRHEYTVGWTDDGFDGTYERVKDNCCFIIDSEGNLTNLQRYDTTIAAPILNIPDKIGGLTINKLDTTFLDAYDQKANIEYVHIPESVSVIGSRAFNGCEKLAEVEFANAMALNEIGEDAFYTQTKQDIQLRFVGVISRDSVESEPFKYAMALENSYTDPNNTYGAKYIYYTNPFPYNLQVELVIDKDPTTGAILKATPTLVDAPSYEDFQSGAGGADACTYSLSSNPTLRAEQNAIVASAYEKYYKASISENSTVVYSPNEEAVLDAIFRVTIPDGVYDMKDDVYQGNEHLTSIILNSITDVPDGAFAGCTNLTSFIMRESGMEGGERIGAKAFEGDYRLTTVSLPSTLNEMDSLPFYECTKLESVGFSGSPKFSCTDAVIYEKKEDGTKRIVECLKTRGNGVGTSTLGEEVFTNVSEIAPSAFEGCDGIKMVYFGSAPLKAIPEKCFSDCVNLFYCEVSDQTEDIGDYAFRNTALSGIKIPSKAQFISGNAFVQKDNTTLIPGLIIECENPSAAYTYAQHYGFTVEEIVLPEYKVEFYNHDGTVLLDTQNVKKGADAVPPEAPEREGWVFTRWWPDYKNVTAPLQVMAQYEPKDPEAPDDRKLYTVIFYNYDGSLKISTQKVREGDAAKAPETVPEREGYTFIGWLPEFNNIIEDTNVYAQYRAGGSTPGNPNDPDDPNNPNNPDKPNNPNDPNNPSNPSNPGGSNGTTNNPNNPGGSNGTTNNPNGSTNTNKPGTSTNKPGSTVSGNKPGNKPSSSGGTKVNVNKNGISNSGLVSATVNGSSDDYVVKITDSEAARNAVEQALLNEYGTLDNIRYFAMDISLYDKTGTTKIQNTDGISVTITMPIPDALVSYAGNNKAGAVINNNTLEKLQARFTTIDGVPCISFVAKHFSPYTIYVDLNNMSASGAIDATPVTGDPIHPKWFLSIGLALMSVIMFFMKGSKRTVVKVISG